MGLNASLMGQVMDHLTEARCPKCGLHADHDPVVHGSPDTRCTECGSPYHWPVCPSHKGA